MTAEPRGDAELLRRTDAMRANADRVRAYPSYSVRQLADDARWLMGEYAERLDRLAAADRENAELRGEVERLRELVRANAHAVLTFERERNSARAQLAAAERDRDEGRSERDDAGLLWGRHYNDAMGALETQLAAAQAQLAEARRAVGYLLLCHDTSSAQASDWLSAWRTAGAVMARATGYDGPALSAAPQPEPERLPISPWSVGDLLAPNSPDEPLPKPDRRSSLRPEPPASDEPTGRSD